MAGLVGLSKPPARLERDTHNTEIVRRYNVKPEQRKEVARCAAQIIKFKRALGDAPVQRKRIDQRDRANSGRTSDLLENTTVESQAAASIATERLIGSDARGNDVLRPKAGIDVRKRPKTTDQQTCGNNEQRRQADFSHRERTAN